MSSLLSNKEGAIVKRKNNKIQLSPTTLDRIHSRIAEITNTRTQQELAAILGIRQSSVSSTKTRKSIPSDWYLTLYDMYGVNPDWLRFGTGPKYLRTETGYIQQKEEKPFAVAVRDFNSLLVKPVYGPFFSMECIIKSQEISPKIIGNIVLPEAYWGNNISVFCVNTNSLSPLIKKGALVGINTSQKHPASGEIFASIIPLEGIILGCLYYDDSESTFNVKTNHTVYKLSPESIESQLIGKMSWVLQEA